MTTNFKLITFSIFMAFIALTVSSCKKEKIADLGALPVLDFEAVSGTNPNNITLVNTSPTAVIPYWRIGNSSILVNGDSAQYSFVFAGTYKVTMFGIGHGGIDSITKDIVIAQSDLNACVGTQLGFITSCTTKKWKLNPEAGTYKVGDASPDAGNWWSSDAAEVTARACEFNDEYNFSFDANGTFVYDNKGDFFGDGYLGDNSYSCQPSVNYTAVQAPWGSGTFQYSFTANAGVNSLGQLTVIGLGAHIGLQKVRNGGEVTSSPATSITYDILEMTQNAGGLGYDILKLGVNIGGDAWWSFTLRSY
ncbi:MAG TPA: hypothetical protein VJ111_12340 [Chitinophagaceae bacterium]|nr:hypothetical protein [Chitinophagaceae bacterium]